MKRRKLNHSRSIAADTLYGETTHERGLVRYIYIGAEGTTEKNTRINSIAWKNSRFLIRENETPQITSQKGKKKKKKKKKYKKKKKEKRRFVLWVVCIYTDIYRKRRQKLRRRTTRLFQLSTKKPTYIISYSSSHQRPILYWDCTVHRKFRRDGDYWPAFGEEKTKEKSYLEKWKQPTRNCPM